MPEVTTVKLPDAANFPWGVQTLPAENWNTYDVFVTEAAARQQAESLQGSYPKLAVRIVHWTGGPIPTPLLPVYRQKKIGELPFDKALWSGSKPPPERGATVQVAVNGLGEGIVMGYIIQGGYLAVMVRFNEATRPAWHKKQNPTNEPVAVFGTEIRE